MYPFPELRKSGNSDSKSDDTILSRFEVRINEGIPDISMVIERAEV